MMRRSVKAKKPQALPPLLAVIGLSFFTGLPADGKSAFERDTAGFLKKGLAESQPPKALPISFLNNKAFRGRGSGFQTASSVDKLWSRALVFRGGREILYSLKGAPDFIALLREVEGFSQKGDLSPEDFFNKLEAEKNILFQSLSLSERKLDFSEIKKEKGLMAFKSKGSYKDFKGESSLFEDWSFYHRRLTFHFLIHFRTPPGLEEKKALELLFKNFVFSKKQLSQKDKALFWAFFSGKQKG